MTEQELFQRRIARRYKKLLPIEGRSLTPVEREMLSGKGYKNRLIYAQDDIMRQVFLFSLLCCHEFVDIEVLNVYDLIDIYLEKNRRYERLLDITPRVLCMYAGYNEFTNQRLEEAATQVIANQKVRHNNVWVFVKGTPQSFGGKYPIWLRDMKENGFEEIYLPTSKSSKSQTYVEGDDL